jgi:serine/threonine-protein kinase HipA
MIQRRGAVFYRGLEGNERIQAGWIEEHDDQYVFFYDPEYLAMPEAASVSLTLPLRKEPFTGSRLFSFFDGLIPEGWLLDAAERNWKINPRDRMGLLLACCKDTIGAVSVEKAEIE